MRGVKYVGPLWDHSGYGEASRNYVLALHEAGVPLTTEPRRFEANPPPVGTDEERKILKGLVGKDIDYDIVIVHLTPDLAPQYIEQNPGKYMIGYTVWETSHIHPVWVDCCNRMDEVWVPCKWNVEAFKESGVRVPIHRIHHGIKSDIYDDTGDLALNLAGVGEDTFLFASIMQWNARKNPNALLRAYFNAFNADDDVRLVLKTYIGRGLPPTEEARQIREAINHVKSDMQLRSYPRINLITDNLSTEQLRSIYHSCDAYVSLTHGEGFGLCMLEAGLAGKPVIATGMGGNMEYMDEDNSFPVPFIWDYVVGMGSFNPWYLGSQKWAEPSSPDAAALMRYVYDNREEANKKGERLRDKIKEEFNWEVVSQQMISRMKDLLWENKERFDLSPAEKIEYSAESFRKQAMRDYFKSAFQYELSEEELSFIPGSKKYLDLYRSIQDDERSPVSLIIIAKDEEDAIQGAIDSVKDLVSEIIVLDTGSTDKTLEIARNNTSRVYQLDFTNFGDIANRGIELASFPVIFILDCDERLIRKELFREHAQAILDGDYEAVALPRSRWADWEMTRQIERNAYPDWQVRMFLNKPGIRFRRSFPHVEFHGCAVEHFEPEEVPEVAHFCDMFPERRKVRYEQNKREAAKGGLKFFVSECCRQEVFVCSNHDFLETDGCSVCENFNKMVHEITDPETVGWSDVEMMLKEFHLPLEVLEKWQKDYKGMKCL